MPGPALQTRGLTKRYGEGAVGIQELDLEVERGEVFGFLGPNGAGKTTTIRLLLDLIRPTSGHAAVLGHDCQQESMEVRRQVGYLPGELSLWPESTGRETVDHLARVRGEPVDDAEIRRLAQRLGAEMDRPVGELSSGNKQKLGLVQALMARPPLLILDEPTRGLDPFVQREVLDLVAEAKDEGRTVFFSSHVLHEVEQVCDRVGIVRDGRLVTVEDVDDLIHQSSRRIEIVFRRAPPGGTFADLDGVRDVQVDGVRLRLTMEGAVDPLVKRLAEHEVVDLRSHDPSLEEVFLEAYGAEGHREGSRGS